MKTRIFLLACIILLQQSLSAQVKIGDNSTTVNSGSLLELESTSKGFVPPRVSIPSVSATSPLPSGIITGTIVYNTNASTTGGSGVGLYIWSGSSWTAFTTSSSSTSWSTTGNSGTNSSTNFLGTTDNKSLSIRTNNVQRMLIDSIGAVAIGSTSFDATDRERLLVDYGTTTSNNIATFKGSINDYLQIGVQNKNSGNNASSDFVATADNGSDSTNYIDMGINSSTYAPGVENFGSANDGYLYTYAKHLLIGTAAANTDLIFLVSGGQINKNTAMRISGSTGNVIIGKGDNTLVPAGNTLRAPNANNAGSNLAGGSLSILGGNSTGTAAGGSINITGGATSGSGSGGSINVKGGSTSTGTMGSVNVNASTNSATNINTGTSTSDVTIGNSSNNVNLPKLSASSVVLTDASKNLTSTTPSSNTYLYYNGTNFSWQTAAANLASLTNGSGIAALNYNGSSAATVSLANGTAAGQVYVTGALPYTPSLVTMSGDATINSTGTLSLVTVNSNVGTFNNVTVNAKGLITAASNIAYSTLGSFSATAPLTYNSTTGVFAINQSTAASNGYLSSIDWNTFNNKVGSITLNTPASIFSTPVSFAISSGSATGSLSLATQTANTVFAGPVSGLAAAPTFRPLVAADIPSLSGSYIQNQTTQQTSSNFNISGNGTIGTNLSVTGTSTLTGAVTSKAGITNTGIFTSSGGAANINASSNSATNINTGTSTSDVTIGNSSNNVNLPKLSASSVVLTDASKNLTSTTPSSNTYLYYNGTNFSWQTAAANLASLTNGSGIAALNYNGSSVATVSLANGTAAGQVYVTGALPYTPSLVTMSGDATINSTGALSLATVNSNVGTFNNVTVNAKGLITAASNIAYSTLGSFSATAPLTYNSTTGVFAINQSTAASNGYLSSADWNTFNNKVDGISLNAPASIFSTPVNFAISSGSATGSLSLATQTANTVFAGPASGTAAAPTFRALVAADIPSLSGGYIQNQTTQQASSNFNISGNGTIGTNLSVTGTSTLTGAVTSKAGITNTGIFTSSGGAANINASSNNATNINTGTSTSNVTIGGSSNNILLPKFATTGGLFFTSATTGVLANTSADMTWDDVNKRLGIGTTSPAYKLQVIAPSNPLYLGGVQATSAFATDSILTIYNGVVKKAPYSSLDSTEWSLKGNSGTNSSINFLGTTDNASLRFRTNNTERVYIDSSTGYLGVGTTSPAARLHVREDVSNPGIILDRVSNNSFASTMMLRKARSLSPGIAVASGDILGSYVAAGYNGSDFGGPNTGMTVRSTQAWTSTANGSEILFRNIANNATNFAYHMGIYQNGRVGIADDAGTSVAYAKLHVNASGGVASGMTAMTGDGIALTGDHFYFENPASTSGERVFSFANNSGVLTINANTNDASTTAPSTSLPGAIALKASNGYVGINTNNPLNQLHVAATANPLKLEGLQAGTSADSILTINNGGVVKYRLLSDIGGNFWSLTGNSGTSYATNFLGTTDNTSLRFRTNNTQRMMIDSIGAVAIGSTSFDANDRERLLVDYGTTTSNNIATFKGSINDYLQIGVQNKSSGSSASSDIVATADNGSDSTNYIDMGINSSTYAPGVENFGNANDGYLYTYAKHLLIGTAAANTDLIFLVSGGQINKNTAMRISGSTGNVIIGKGDNTLVPAGNTLRAPNANNAGSNLAGGSLSILGGNSTGTAAGGSINITGGATSGSGSGGSINVKGGSTSTGTMGSVNVNASTNSATNINTGTSTSDVTIGNNANNILLPKFNTTGGMFYTSASTGQIGNTASNMTWDDVNGRLGIGITSPSTTLHVNGTAGFGSASSTSGKLSFYNSANANTANIISGTTSSTYTLTLPTAAPTSNGQVLSSTTGGILSWSTISSGGSGSAWQLTGNSGTNGAINFVGTTDAQPLVIKSLDRQMAYFDGNLYSIALGYGALNGSSDHNVAIGYSATTNNQYTLALGYNATATGVRSIAIGNGAAAAIASGAEAIAIGYNAISSNVQSMAMGYQSTASGAYGVAIGYGSLASASQSTAIGYSSLASAQYSNAIGYQAHATGLQSTAIGYNAQTAQSNTILLGDVSTPGLHVGIGTASPSAKLDIVASAGNNPLELTGLPAGTVGTDNILTINSSGVVGYATPAAFGNGYWSTSGNAASSGNFLGTTNTIPLQFKFNSIVAGYLDANNTALGTSYTMSGTQNTAIGYSANAANSSTAVGANSDASFASNTAIGNSATANISSQATAIGASAQALYQYNTAIGYNAQATTTSQETVIGASAQATGQNNIAIGYTAKATGSDKITVVGSSAQASFQNNTVVGYGATATVNNQATAIGAASAASAQNATALGYNASATGANSTAIGYTATTSQANAIVLGISSTNVGIATSSPNTSASLDVNGKFKLGDVGTVNKNVVSFATPSGTVNLTAGSGTGNNYNSTFTDITITIPSSSNYLTGTQATVAVSPSADLPSNVHIAFARMISTSQVKIRLMNSSTTAQSYTGQFYITVTEF